MKYSDITLHQRISLKGLFTSEKERRDIGITDHYHFKVLGTCLALFGFVQTIEYYLSGDIKSLKLRNT